VINNKQDSTDLQIQHKSRENDEKQDFEFRSLLYRPKAVVTMQLHCNGNDLAERISLNKCKETTDYSIPNNWQFNF